MDQKQKIQVEEYLENLIHNGIGLDLTDAKPSTGKIISSYEQIISSLDNIDSISELEDEEILKLKEKIKDVELKLKEKSKPKTITISGEAHNIIKNHCDNIINENVGKWSEKVLLNDIKTNIKTILKDYILIDFSSKKDNFDVDYTDIEYLNERIKKYGVIYGEFELSNNFDTSLTKASHSINNIRQNVHCIVGDITILSTYFGKILKENINDYMFVPRIIDGVVRTFDATLKENKEKNNISYYQTHLRSNDLERFIKIVNDNLTMNGTFPKILKDEYIETHVVNVALPWFKLNYKNEGDLFINNPYFLKYVLSWCKIEQGRLVSRYDYYLPGGVKLNHETMLSEGKEEMEEVKLEISNLKLKNPIIYLIDSPTMEIDGIFYITSIINVDDMNEFLNSNKNKHIYLYSMEPTISHERSKKYIIKIHAIII